jgi:3-oxoacyl-[acyl-carrier protein] reductase
MLLEKKNAVIYGAGGAIGSRLTRAFAREGARIFLAGRTLAAVDAVAKEISVTGGAAESAQLDALDEQAIEKHAGDVARKAGSIDVSFNRIAMPHIQGTALVDLSPEDFTQPVTAYAKTCHRNGCCASEDQV